MSGSRKLGFFDSIKLFFRAKQGNFVVFLVLSIASLYALPSYYKYLALFPGTIAVLFSRNSINLFIRNKYIFEHGAIAYGDYLDVFVKEISKDDGPDLYGVKYSFQVNSQKYYNEETVSVAFGKEFPEVGQYGIIYYLPHNPRQHLAPELIGIRNINANMDGPQNH